MLFSEFSQYLQKLEDTTKRLEITDILTDLIKNLSADEVDIAMYLALGYLKAPFETKRFNIAEKMMIRALESAFPVTGKDIKGMYADSGDLGDVAQEINKSEQNNASSVEEIYKKLFEIAAFEGTGSQDKKVIILAKLLKQTDPLSTKYIVRIVLGTTRLGFTELTIIDALSNLLEGNKSLKKEIEKKYNLHPDIGLITKKIKEGGMSAIEDIQMETGVPILPQKAQRLGTAQEIIEKMGSAWAEYKIDGTRVQLHLDKTKEAEKRADTLFAQDQKGIFVKTYTRNLDETTHQFPDIIAAAKKHIKAESVILDGEAIAYDKKTGNFLTFQETIKRKRKHGVEDIKNTIPLKYLVFDIIYHNGKSLIEMPLHKRNALLQEIVEENDVIECIDHLKTTDAEELEGFFVEAKDKNLEGIMAKNPDSGYEAGARAFSWVKLKRIESGNLQDTVDCVVLGYYFGKGVRANFGIGGFLVGVYDKEKNEFKTISKIGTGLKDEDWVTLKEKCDKIKTNEKPKNVDVPKELSPDVWTSPKIVVVIRSDEISKSPLHNSKYALRFPRLMEFREDKSPQDATSIKEIKDLYKMQFKN
jgi:DNA ligase 1